MAYCHLVPHRWAELGPPPAMGGPVPRDWRPQPSPVTPAATSRRRGQKAEGHRPFYPRYEGQHYPFDMDGRGLSKQALEDREDRAARSPSGGSGLKAARTSRPGRAGWRSCPGGAGRDRGHRCQDGRHGQGARCGIQGGEAAQEPAAGPYRAASNGPQVSAESVSGELAAILGRDLAATRALHLFDLATCARDAHLSRGLTVLDSGTGVRLRAHRPRRQGAYPQA